MFDCTKYNFIDSIITKIELDVASGDLLIIIDYFKGKNNSDIITLRLKNIRQFTFNKVGCGLVEDKWTPFTIADITKSSISNKTRLTVSSTMSFLPGHENDAPILDCVCEEVNIE